MEPIKNAVVAGHLCLDVIPRLDLPPGGQMAAYLQPGRLNAVGAAEVATGGPVSNTGLALHRLGVPTRLIAKVGDDAFGAVVRDLVRGHAPALAEGLTIDESVPTSYSIALSAPGLDRIFFHCAGANDTFSADDIDPALLSEAALFHFGYPPIMRRMYEDDGRELTKVFRQAKATGLTTSLDLALPDPSSDGGRADWRSILQRTLPFVDLFLPSIEEVLFMLRPDFYHTLSAEDLIEALTPDLLDEVADEVLAWGAKIVLLKLGHRGVYLRTAGALAGLGRAAPSDLRAWEGLTLWAPCFRVDVMGTTGAGDTTIAGFLAAFLRDATPSEAMTMAVAVGACNVEAPDALGGLRSWQDTRSRIRAGWSRLPMDLSGYGWRWEGQVWRRPETMQRGAG